MPESEVGRQQGSRFTGALVAAAAGAAGWLAAVELGLDAIIGIDGEEWITAALAIGGSLGLLRMVRLVGITSLASIGILLAVQWTPWPARLGRQMIRSDSLPGPAADAIVVLSASLTDEGLLTGVAVDRLLEGARLYRAGAAPRLVLSRIETDIDGRLTSSDGDQRAVLALAGLDPALEIVAPVGTTRLEAERVAEQGRGRGWRRIVVVTSPSHTRRACATFEAVGFEVTCRAAPDRQVAWGQLDSPGDRAAAFGQWMYEVLGLAKYRAMGWLGERVDGGRQQGEVDR